MDLILTMSCTDSVGIIARTTAYFRKNDLNIIEINQYVDTWQNRFFMRVEYTIPDSLSYHDHKISISDFMNVEFSNDQWDLRKSEEPVRTAIFVTHELHCLLDILSRSIDDELNIDVVLIISNHESLRNIADKFEIPFYHIPVTKGLKAAVEQQQLKFLWKIKLS